MVRPAENLGSVHASFSATGNARSTTKELQQDDAVTDSGFPRGGGANSRGHANIRFCQFLLAR